MARLPDIALRVHGGMAPSACINQAAAADRGGFSTLWFAENPFNRGVWPAMAACAVATRRLRIGAGVFNPFARHPTLMAMEIGAFDELAGGRAVLGIGAGVAGKIAQLKVPSDRPIAAVRDAVEITRRLLRGGDMQYTGPVFSAEGVRLEFPLLRAEVPILTAAMGTQALRLCGEIADGLMISNMCPPASTRRAVAIMREAARQAGRPTPPEVVQYVPCIIADDAVTAREDAKRVVGGMLTAYWRGASPATRSAMTGAPHLDAGDFARMMKRLETGASPSTVIDDTVLAEYAVAGTLDDCLEQSVRYGDAGVTELGVWFVGDRALEDIARFGDALEAVRRRP